jgi:acetyl-CoA carboxylase carboxyl transferase subunit alpha
MKNLGLVDDVITEPLGGAHRNPEAMYEIVRNELVKHINELSKMDNQKRLDSRLGKFLKMGVVNEK